jgi:hypothetical protein
MPKEKQQKKKGPSLRHAPLGAEVDTKKQKVLVPSNRDEDDYDGSTDMTDESNLPQNLGAQIFNQAREQRQEMSVIQSSTAKAGVENDDSDFEVSQPTHIDNQDIVYSYCNVLSG